MSYVVLASLCKYSDMKKHEELSGTACEGWRKELIE